MKSGTLKITIVEATLQWDVEGMGGGKMDTYVKVKWTQDGEEQEYKTKVMQEAGKTPNWGEETTPENFVEVRVEDMFTEIIDFRVKDEGSISNTEIGGFSIDYSGLCFNYGVDQWFTLMHNNSKSGSLRLKTEYIDDECPRKNLEDIAAEVQKIKNQLGGVMESHDECPDVEDFIPIDLSDTIRREGLTVTGIDGFGEEKVEKVCTVKTENNDKLCAYHIDDWFIQYDFVKPILLRGYGVSNANDSPGHDANPKVWEFSIMEVNIHTGEDLNDGEMHVFP
jgi:hypothetical protein